MGLGDFFANYKADRERKALLKNIRRLIHQDLQHEDRLRSAEFLSEVGTDEALFGLLRRFDMSLDKGYMDQDEKTFVHDVLVSKGDEAVGPIEKFLSGTENVSWPERILAAILRDEEAVVTVLLRVLIKEHETGSDLQTTKRSNLLELFTRHQDPRIADAVSPFLADFDESVRLGAVAALDHQADAQAVDALAKLFVDPEEESFRVRSRILDAFVEHTWQLPKEQLETAADRVPVGYAIAGNGAVSRG